MNRKSFLDELKVLLCVNLEPSEVKSAYQYYSELFDEEDEDALISRLGSPQRTVDGILDDRGSLFLTRHAACMTAFRRILLILTG